MTRNLIGRMYHILKIMIGKPGIWALESTLQFTQTFIIVFFNRSKCFTSWLFATIVDTIFISSIILWKLTIFSAKWAWKINVKIVAYVFRVISWFVLVVGSKPFKFARQIESYPSFLGPIEPY